MMRSLVKFLICTTEVYTMQIFHLPQFICDRILGTHQLIFHFVQILVVYLAAEQSSEVLAVSWWQFAATNRAVVEADSEQKPEEAAVVEPRCLQQEYWGQFDANPMDFVEEYLMLQVEGVQQREQLPVEPLLGTPLAEQKK